MAANSTSKLATAFRAAASDGQVSAREANSLVALAAKDTLTGAEIKVMAQQVKLLQDKFEPAAKTQLSRFVAAAQKGAHTADPRVMNRDVGSVSYRAAVGSLYRNGVGARDVMQGAAGDCYLVSTLSAAAAQRPALISNAITRKADGSFLVRFYQPGADGKPVPVYVPVDKDLPRDRWGNSRYSHSSARGELWVGVMEKAYAKFKGSYEKIGNGGNPADVMMALTGKQGGYSLTGEGPAATVFEQMKSKLAAKGLVCASTRTGAQYRGTGVVQSHAYTVLGVSESGGTKYVTVRNPWGKTEPGQPRGGDGVFRLPMSRFVKLFPDLFMSA